MKKLSEIPTMRLKQYFYLGIHLMFLSGLLYAFYHFLLTPRSLMEIRRLWAYESWTILSFYGLFTYLILTDREYREATRVARGANFRKFLRILQINLLLLIFPWGVFLLVAPSEFLGILGLTSVYWRVLGACSLLGAMIYALPVWFYKKRFTYYILLFGAFDNFLAAAVVLYLFFRHLVPLVAFAGTPLLFYFSYFFLGSGASV